jgi:hypothetical protein
VKAVHEVSHTNSMFLFDKERAMHTTKNRSWTPSSSVLPIMYSMTSVAKSTRYSSFATKRRSPFGAYYASDFRHKWPTKHEIFDGIVISVFLTLLLAFWLVLPALLDL